MKKTIIKYSLATAFGIFFTLTIICSKQIWTCRTKEVFKVLTDSFFASGVILFCFGLLILSYNEGTFDMVMFGVKRFFGLFRKDLSKLKDETFYDYRCAKHEYKKGFGYLLIVGLVFIAFSLLFLIFYYQYN
ncbi:MAG: DUF3899 domain-containing protein [Anaeroplasmataceae bacterium]|nr:DUF3899 domain-containing protein [Anaeroplasmataceae bacterium]